MTTSPLDSSESRTQLSSVWSRSFNAPIREILISQHGVVAVATDTKVRLYVGAPSFGASHTVTLTPVQLTAYSFSSDGSHFLTGDANGFIKWWDVVNGKETGATQFPFGTTGENTGLSICDIKCSVESELVAVAAGHLICIYGHGGLMLHSIGPLESNICSIQWNSDKQLVVNIGIAICMISVSPEEVILGHQYPCGGDLIDGPLHTLSCSPEGTMVAGGCTHGAVRVWDLTSDQNGEISVFLKNFPNSSSGTSVRCLAWDSTGDFLSAAGDNDVIVWDMKDSRNETGNDTSIVCYGHGQKTKVTSLKFQPNGRLLATAGDDCQVLVFDSRCFNSNDVIRGLVGCSLSGRVAVPAANSQTPDAFITALAWHPLGLIFAGTSTGSVDAFEVAETTFQEIKSKEIENTPTQQQHNSFLIHTNPTSKPMTSPQRTGWGGEPIITKQNDGYTIDKFIRKPKSIGTPNSTSTGGGGGRYIKNTTDNRRQRVYQGKFKSQSGTYDPPSMPQQQPLVQFNGYPQPIPTYMSPYHGPPTHLPNPPHTPESSSSDTSGHPMRPGPVHHASYSMGYLPCPPGYPMGYPPAPYGYYPVTPGGPPAPPGGMIAPMRDQYGIQSMNKAFQGMSVVPDGGGQESSELDEELRSKSSEATNNGVTSDGSPTNPDNRETHGQTLYVGNLGLGVDEMMLVHYFSPFGPIVNVQVIRDRFTQASRGFAFVSFAHPFYAQTAMQHMDTVQIPGPFEGRRLKVSFSNRR